MPRTLGVLALLIFLLAVALVPALAQDGAPADPGVAPQAQSGMVTGLWHLHGWLRWLVVVATIAAGVKMLLGFARSDAYDSWARRLMLAFAMSLSLQWLVGVVLLLVMGNFGVRYRWEHAAVMTVAVALAHLHNRWKNADARTRYRNNLLIILVVLVLVYVGVALLPQGWRLMPVTG